MIAIVAGFLLVGYLLAPGAIYRVVFSYFVTAKRFQRTRTEEVVFSVLVTLFPFVATLLLMHLTALGRLPVLHHGSSKLLAYEAVLNSVLPGGVDVPQRVVFEAYLRSFGEQARFIAYLWFLSGLEGWVGSWIISHYGDYRPGSWLKRLCDKTLLRHVSEWELLFTTLAQPPAERHRTVEVDALSTTGVLYRGQLEDWFVDSEGKLAGIYLVRASRFARDLLERDRDDGLETGTELYWKAIPGAQLYLVASAIANYNIRYVESPRLEPSLTDDLLGQGVVITPLPAENTEE